MRLETNLLRETCAYLARRVCKQDGFRIPLGLLFLQGWLLALALLGDFLTELMDVCVIVADSTSLFLQLTTTSNCLRR